jgi:hypothetical protein
MKVVTILSSPTVLCMYGRGILGRFLLLAIIARYTVILENETNKSFAAACSTFTMPIQFS